MYYDHYSVQSCTVTATFTFAEDSARKPRWNTRTPSRFTVLTRTLNQLQDRVWCRWNITWQHQRCQCFVYCILHPAMFKMVQQWWTGFSSAACVQIQAWKWARIALSRNDSSVGGSDWSYGADTIFALPVLSFHTLWQSAVMVLGLFFSP